MRNIQDNGATRSLRFASSLVLPLIRHSWQRLSAPSVRGHSRFWMSRLNGKKAQIWLRTALQAVNSDLLRRLIDEQSGHRVPLNGGNAYICTRWSELDS